jgi:hypothetical protein
MQTNTRKIKRKKLSYLGIGGQLVMTTQHYPLRKVLEGIPKVAFAPIHDGKWEFTPFPSCLKACLKYLNHEVPYHYLLSTSGGAFRLVWHSKRWEGGNVDIMVMDEDPLKPFHRGFESVGFSTRIALNKGYIDNLDLDQSYLQENYADKEAIKKIILEQINSGYPVIGLGIVGPPETSIIAGYDNNGETLIGWSLFQEHLDPSHDITEQEDAMFPPTGIEESGYFRQDDWFRKTVGILTIGEKSVVDYPTIYRKTLEWIIEIIKTPMINDFYTGIKAFDAYIGKMQDDTEFPVDNLEMLAERKMVHYDAMTMISERSGGSLFLKEVASHPNFLSAADELNTAAELFENTSLQMRKWWEIVGPIWDDEERQIKVVADPEVRAAFIPVIQTCRRNDEEAVEQIEMGLDKLGN